MNKLSVILLTVFLFGCKTFITKDGDFDIQPSYITNRLDEQWISERMCLNFENTCRSKKDTIEIIKINEDTYAFHVTRSLLNNFNSRPLKKEIESRYKFKKYSGPNSIEEAALTMIFDFAMDTTVRERRMASDAKKEAELNRKKKSYINSSIDSLFPNVRERLDDNPNNSQIGLAFKLIEYERMGDRRGLAELYFIDFANKNRKMGNTVYAYLGFISPTESNNGTIYIHVPSCYIMTSRRIDGCLVKDWKTATEYIYKSQENRNAYGKSYISFALSKYIPPPEEPQAQGILSVF